MKRLLYILAPLFLLVSCNDDTKVKSVKLSPDELSLYPGESKMIELSILPLTAVAHNPYSFESSDPNVAVVSKDGIVTAIYSGECIITGRAMNVEDYCKVTVDTLDFSNIKFDDAIVFNNGPFDGKDVNDYIVRLYQNSINIDSVGHSSGNGFFLNLNLCAQKSDLLPEGEYVINNDTSNFSIIPGGIRKIGNSSYAMGSYVGFYNVYGLSVVFLDEGSINLSIKKDSLNKFVHCFEYDLKGEKEEIIKNEYCGKVQYYDTDTESSDVIIEYNSVREESMNDVLDEPYVNHSRISFNATDTVIEFIARYPKSITFAPDGIYHTNAEAKYFTLMSEENIDFCKIISNNDTTIIPSAKLRINTDSEGNKSYSATFSDRNNTTYTLHPKSLKNISIIHKIKNLDFVD